MFQPDILCTTDLSPAAGEGIREGVRLAADLGASVTVLFVVDTGPVVQMATNFLPESQRLNLMAGATSDARRELEMLCANAATGGIEPKPVVIQAPHVAQGICDYAEEQGSQMIVTATHGRSGLAHMLLGSVAERVVRTARCPVLVVRRSRSSGDSRVHVENILVAVDFSDASQSATDTARQLARDTGARVHLLTVHDLPLVAPYGGASSEAGLAAGALTTLLNSREDVRARLFDLRDSVRAAGIEATAHQGEGGAAYSITDTAEALSADLIVMGTHGRTGLERFMVGSVAERVVRTATCPVLVVPLPGVDAAAA